jgi:hypothetical protein
LAGAGEILARALATVRARPGRALGLSLIGAMVAAVWANALFMQSSRHPTPLVARTAAPAPAARIPAQSPAQVPAARAEAPAVPMPAVAALPPARPADLSPAAVPQAAAPPARRADPIASLIARTGEAGADDQILAVQKALNQAGFGPIAEDGRPGAETRRAIERFQVARGLPKTGEINRRVMDDLGLRIR